MAFQYIYNSPKLKNSMYICIVVKKFNSFWTKKKIDFAHDFFSSVEKNFFNIFLLCLMYPEVEKTSLTFLWDAHMLHFPQKIKSFIIITLKKTDDKSEKNLRWFCCRRNVF